MAENSEALCRDSARFIENRIRIPTRYINAMTWQERERLFDSGEIDILWLCGLPYVQKRDAAKVDFELLAVPVPQGQRYHGKPVYFSDVVVRRDSPLQAFWQLRGSPWAYNEQRSHSGFEIIRAHLADLGEFGGFFGKVVESGAHSSSLEMVSAGKVDGAAIDSTVLEWYAAQRPELASALRVIATLGPSPIPPWVISRRVPARLRHDIRAVLLGMHAEAFGSVMLARARMERFVGAHDRDYDPIRTAVRKAASVSLV